MCLPTIGRPACRQAGSSPFTRTKPQQLLGFFYALIPFYFFKLSFI